MFTKDLQVNNTFTKARVAKAQYEKARRRRRNLSKKADGLKTECGLKVLLVVQDDKTMRIYNSKPEHQELLSLLNWWNSSPSSCPATMDEGGIVQVWSSVIARRVYHNIKQRSETSSSATPQTQRREFNRPRPQMTHFKRTAFVRAKDWLWHLRSVAALVLSSTVDTSAFRASHVGVGLE
jgi:hypothetical protein